MDYKRFWFDTTFLDSLWSYTLTIVSQGSLVVILSLLLIGAVGSFEVSFDILISQIERLIKFCLVFTILINGLIYFINISWIRYGLLYLPPRKSKVQLSQIWDEKGGCTDPLIYIYPLLTISIVIGAFLFKSQAKSEWIVIFVASLADSIPIAIAFVVTHLFSIVIEIVLLHIKYFIHRNHRSPY